MAAYSLEQDQRDQSPFKDTLNITPAYINKKIAEADGIINSIIGGTYVLPLPDPAPTIIIDLSKEITTLLLFREQDKNIEVQPGLSIEEAWKACMDLLASIKTRDVKLFDSAGIELPLRPTVFPKFYPNAQSSSPSISPNTAPRFTMDDIN